MVAVVVVVAVVVMVVVFLFLLEVFIFGWWCARIGWYMDYMYIFIYTMFDYLGEVLFKTLDVWIAPMFCYKKHYSILRSWTLL